ncbi:uncharacterized protein [Musca autumnalis]|uniref:uncharacterized protein n=1 Tax=Musca autumnalis TaxID=221902 RepID=UPI003CF707D5
MSEKKLWETFNSNANILNGQLTQKTKPQGCSTKTKEGDDLRSSGQTPKMHIYNPQKYSHEIFEEYLQKYLNGTKTILFVGMNPRTEGELHTGVPFGDIVTVRDGMQLHGALKYTLKDNPRLYDNIEYGWKHFWSLIKKRLEDTDDFLKTFFEQCFVYNFCPLAFINEKWERESLETCLSIAEYIPYINSVEKACLKTLEKQFELLKPTTIIAMGKYIYEMLQIESIYCCGKDLLYMPDPLTAESKEDWEVECIEFFTKNNILQKQPETPDDSASPFNPTDEFQRRIVRKNLNEGKQVLFIFMDLRTNGEIQTGVHIGDIDTVKNRLLESNDEGAGNYQHICRTIETFLNDPDLFKKCLVHNFCPIPFIDDKKQRVSLETLAKNKEHNSYIEQVKNACLDSLERRLEKLQPAMIIAMGDYIYGNLPRDSKNVKRALLLQMSYPQYCDDFYKLECELKASLSKLEKPEGYVSDSANTHDRVRCYIYNPLEYAYQIYYDYLRMFLDGPKKVLFVGMNPGPLGALQTGIPFGDIETVKDRMKLEGEITKPPKLHPKIIIKGLNYSWKEDDKSSSFRFWQLIKELFNDCEDFVDKFFKQCFVHNFCPLAYIAGQGWIGKEEDGNNVSIEKLKEHEKKNNGNYAKKVGKACLHTMEEQLNLLQPDRIICIGNYVHKMLSKLDDYKEKLIKIPHPSPKNEDFADSSDWVERCKEILLKDEIFSNIMKDHYDTPVNENQANVEEISEESWEESWEESSEESLEERLQVS